LQPLVSGFNFSFPSSSLLNLPVPEGNWKENTMPSLHRAVSLTLLAAAALACDENAPTETRTAAGPPEMRSADHPAGIEGGEFSPMAIPLPVDQSINTSIPIPAFRIRQTGTGPNASFLTTLSTSTQPTLTVTNAGVGRGGLFLATNTANAAPALEATTQGRGLAFRAVAQSAQGAAGFFQNSSATNAHAALSAESNGTGPAFTAVSTRSGLAARFDRTTTTDDGQATLHTTSRVGTALSVFGGGLRAAAIIRQFGGTNPSLFLASAGPRALAADISGTVRVRGNVGEAVHALQVDGGLGVTPRMAASFVGNVTVLGTLTKSAGSFRIDHPLDPEHKVLSHSFVESPDMMNVYNGNVTLDETGRATVELPGYFEALNKDFRYQLTAIGAPGPNLYIAEGVQQNRFRIAGGRPYARVSWQVTGVRQDAYANEHRIKVEEEKPAAEPQLAER
jgi:hypothetical protein